MNLKDNISNMLRARAVMAGEEVVADELYRAAEFVDAMPDELVATRKKKLVQSLVGSPICLPMLGCSVCGATVTIRDTYCHQCGRRLLDA